MEQYLEIIEFIKAHRAIGFTAKKIKEEIIGYFELDTNLSVEVSDNIIDLIYKESGARIVTATSIFIENE